MKQEVHHWYEELWRILLKLGYKICLADEAVFYKFDGNKFMIIAAVMDNFTFIANSTESTTFIKKQMNEHFKIVDLAPSIGSWASVSLRTWRTRPSLLVRRLTLSRF